MSELLNQTDKLWTGQASTAEPAFHPFAPLRVLEELAPGVAFYKGFVNITGVKTGEGLVLVDTGFVSPGRAQAQLRFPARLEPRAPAYGGVHARSRGSRLWVAAVSRRSARARLGGAAHRRPRQRAAQDAPLRRDRGLQLDHQFAPVRRRYAVAGRVPGADRHLRRSDRRSMLAVRASSCITPRARPTTTPGSGCRTRRPLCTGDLFIWAAPNAGNPQKVQRYAVEWAAALRAMAALGPELLLPGHGLPIAGAARVREALIDTATYLESLVHQTLERLNAGQTIYESSKRSARPPRWRRSPICGRCTTSPSSSCATCGAASAAGTAACRAN